MTLMPSKLMHKAASRGNGENQLPVTNGTR